MLSVRLVSFLEWLKKNKKKKRNRLVVLIT